MFGKYFFIFFVYFFSSLKSFSSLLTFGVQITFVERWLGHSFKVLIVQGVSSKDLAAVLFCYLEFNPKLPTVKKTGNIWHF